MCEVFLETLGTWVLKHLELSVLPENEALSGLGMIRDVT